MLNMDEQEMAQEIGRLTEEVASLRRELKAAKARPAVLARAASGFLGSEGFWGAAILAPLLLLVWMWIAAPHVVDHCYIDAGERDNKSHLFGNVEWAIDKDFGVVASVDEAVQVAEKLKCPFVSTKK